MIPEKIIAVIAAQKNLTLSRVGVSLITPIFESIFNGVSVVISLHSQLHRFASSIIASIFVEKTEFVKSPYDGMLPGTIADATIGEPVSVEGVVSL